MATVVESSANLFSMN